MAEATSLVLTDRASTPVDHTFTPNGFSPDRDVAFFVESDGVPVGDNQFSIAVRRTASRRKATLRLVLPVVSTETVNGIDNPVVVRTAYANVEFNFDSKSTTQERDDCVGMLATALASSLNLVDDSIVNLKPVY